MTAIPAFGTLSEDDYAALGFRCGLEIHQQLLTDKKLFCRCPAGQYSDDFDTQILRHMRPTLSEMGEYDGTALMELKTRKEIIYQLNSERVCTYEMDDSPPFQINEQAVDIALEIAMLLRLQLIDELHIARKQYLDGSIPTGFQRTTILGINGWVPFRGGKLPIRQLGLEEDSCREVSDVAHTRTYIADRLGTPLIEIVTEPEMRTPAQAAEAGQWLRRLTRATGKVRRGIGAARQDVNVSITGGTRIEIKGVSRIPLIPRLVHYEALRQKALLDIRADLLGRSLSPDSFHARWADVTDLLAGVDFEPVGQALAAGGRVAAIVLPRFAGVLARQTQPHTVLLQEFSDRVRVIACLQGRPNLISSEGISPALRPGEWSRVQRQLAAGPDDAVILVWGPAEDVRTAAAEIELRALDALRGVPNETRQAFADGTNGFERILPGPERMYPDTDLPPKVLAPQRIERIRAQIPERPWDRYERYRTDGLSADLALGLIDRGRADLFDRIRTAAPSIPASLVGYFLVCKLTAARRAGLPVRTLDEHLLIDLFVQADRGAWPKEAIEDRLLALLRPAEPHITARSVAAGAPLATNELPRVVEEVCAAAAFSPPRRKIAGRDPLTAHRMGLLMRRLRARAHGAAVRRVVEQLPAPQLEDTAR